MEVASTNRGVALGSSEIEDVRVRMERIDLIKSLDAKLEQYLESLDEYDKVMKAVSKQLSSVTYLPTCPMINPF